jgi:hypothetical protein
MAKKKAKRKRNYRKEYDDYHGTAAQRKRRSSRNKARRKVKKAGGKVKGKDVHHKDGNPKNNKRGNLSVQSRRKNRGNNKKYKGMKYKKRKG